MFSDKVASEIYEKHRQSNWDSNLPVWDALSPEQKAQWKERIVEVSENQLYKIFYRGIKEVLVKNYGSVIEEVDIMQFSLAQAKSFKAEFVILKKE